LAPTRVTQQLDRILSKSFAAAAAPLPSIEFPEGFSPHDYAIFLLHVAAEIEHGLLIQYLAVKPTTPGDAPAAPALLSGFQPRAVLADKADDSNAPRKIIADLDAQAVIPSNRTRKVLIAHDIEAYRAWNRIERCFSKLRHFRRFATRYDRRAVHFLGFIHLATAMVWMR
jgi:transposase